ncbi:hypothetical protein KKC97_14245, partial [bacterium]|nr:hypothetical protein [bacterium]
MSVTTKEATGKVVKNEKSKAAKQKSVFAEFDPLKQKRLTILDHTGKIVAPEWMPNISDELIVEGY